MLGARSGIVCAPLRKRVRSRGSVVRRICKAVSYPKHIEGEATAPDFGRLIMEAIEVQAIEEEGEARNTDAAE